MRRDHEYAIIGHSRVVVSRYLGSLAATLAAAATALGGLLTEAVKDLPAPLADLKVPAVLLGSAMAFSLVHFLFNHVVWRLGPLKMWLRLADLSGKWTVEGETLDMDKNVLHRWTGTATITQSWEKIKVTLRTQQSSSFSVSAALTHEPGLGYRLMYSYRNEPKINEVELSSHVGFAELVFDESLATAEGDYFNSKGRYTFGVMRLKREAADGAQLQAAA